MKKSLFILCCLPTFAFATETGESCSKIEDNAKRLECYDALFLKSPSQTEKEVQQKLDDESAKLKAELLSWQYRETKDEMRDKTSYFASKQSNNTIDLSFPYEGGTIVTLMLRKHGEHGNDVMFFLSKGQFSCRIRGCNISVKFNDGNIEKYAVSESETGPNDLLFLSGKENMKKFMNKLKSANKMVVEFSIYDYGSAQFTFDTQGLEWKHF